MQFKTFIIAFSVLILMFFGVICLYNNEIRTLEGDYIRREKELIKQAENAINDSIKKIDSIIVLKQNKIDSLTKVNAVLTRLIKINKQKSDVKIQVIHSANHNALIKIRDSIRANGGFYLIN